MNKIVPIEPTEEMVLNAVNAFGGVMGTPENLANPEYVNRMLDRQKKAVIEHYKLMLSAAPESDHIIVSRAELDALKADAERLKHCIAIKEFPKYVNHRLEEVEDWCMVVNNQMIIADTAREAIDKARGEK